MLGKRHPSSGRITGMDSPIQTAMLTEETPLYEPYYLSDQNTEGHINQLLMKIHPMMMSCINIEKVKHMKPTQLAIYLKPVIAEVLQKSEIQLSHAERIYLEKKLLDEILGFGPIEPLLHDDTIDDILINGPEQIYVERFGQLQRTHVRFYDNSHIMDTLIRVLNKIGRRIDENNPYVNGRLPDGSRVNAIIPPLSLTGPVVSIRKFRRLGFTLAELVEQHCLTQDMADFIKLGVHAHLNILVSGGTGAGKTTLLNAVSQAIDPNERIVSIEDIAELRLQQEHLVTLETRLANVEGKGAITQRELFVNALRMRPNRIIIGEVRGAEVFDMLQAMNTGHDGSLSTIHASAPNEVITRLIDMVHMTGFTYPAANIMRQIGDAISLIIEITREPSGKRRITKIVDIAGFDGQKVLLNEIFSYDYTSKNFIHHKVPLSFMQQITRYDLEHELNRIHRN